MSTPWATAARSPAAPCLHWHRCGVMTGAPVCASRTRVVEGLNSCHAREQRALTQRCELGGPAPPGCDLPGVPSVAVGLRGSNTDSYQRHPAPPPPLPPGGWAAGALSGCRPQPRGGAAALLQACKRIVAPRTGLTRRPSTAWIDRPQRGPTLAFQPLTHAGKRQAGCQGEDPAARWVHVQVRVRLRVGEDGGVRGGGSQRAGQSRAMDGPLPLPACAHLAGPLAPWQT